MKLNTYLAVPVILSVLFLTACGDKAKDATDAATGAATAVVKDAATATTDAAKNAAATVVKAAPKVEAGGYEPTIEERVPGITREVTPVPADAAAKEAAPTAEPAAEPVVEPVVEPAAK